MIIVICPCGTKIKVKPCLQARKKYCSKECFYRFRKRPSNLKYEIKVKNKGWFKKELIPWNKNKKYKNGPCEVKNGKHYSPKTEFKKGQTVGKKNSNWKGGITPVNAKIRASLKYKKWREKVFKRDKYTCVWCKQVGGELNADHIKQFAYYPKLRFKLSNGRTLCIGCHKKTDTYLRNIKKIV